MIKQQMMFENFSADSKVWIYQSERPFTNEEIIYINDATKVFTKQWTAHNLQLKAAGSVIEDRFILLMVDETQAGASGCSIDKSVHFIQQLQDQLNVNLFNRLLISFKNEKGIHTIPLIDLPKALSENNLTSFTPIFNTTVLSKSQFENQWMIPLNESWAKNRV